MNLSRADVSNAVFEDALFGYSILGTLNLISANGLEKVRHVGPSSIGMDTFCHGSIPEEFLRQAGIPEPFVSNLSSLLVVSSENSVLIESVEFNNGRL